MRIVRLHVIVLPHALRGFPLRRPGQTKDQGFQPAGHQPGDSFGYCPLEKGIFLVPQPGLKQF